MQRNTGYFPTESLEPCGNRLFSRSALNEGYLFRGSLTFMIRAERSGEVDPIVGANERRRAILELLCQRKQDTMKNLANEFHVSLRTICYDIDELARNYPIVTTRGKYKGGVKIADGYRLDRKYLNPEQQHLLKRLSKTLSGEDRNIMESILRDFTLKEISEAGPGY